LDQVPLVDFCNQNNPRAQPQDHPIPRPARRRGAPSLRWAGRKPPDGFEAIRHTDHRLRVVPLDVPVSPSLAARPAWRRLEPRPHPTRRASPAEVSRARGRPAFAARRLSPGARTCHVNGRMKRWMRPKARPRRELRPNPIRSDTSCRAIAVQQMESLLLCGRHHHPAEASWLRYASDDHAARALSLSSERERRAHVAPGAPAFAGCTGAKGRFTRASAKRLEIGRTRGAFHRRATGRGRPGFRPGFARQVGPSPQIVTNLWRTRGAVAYAGRLTLRPGCLDGLPAV